MAPKKAALKVAEGELAEAMGVSQSLFLLFLFGFFLYILLSNLIYNESLFIFVLVF